VYCDPEHQPTLEGPKFHKLRGQYYILAPAGGVKNGWQLALRAPAPFGPYVAKTVLEQGTTSINGPHQGALVDTPRGQWWFVHFQDRGLYGRIVHLNPVTWVDDWPLMGLPGKGGLREPVERYPKPKGPWEPIAPLQCNDEFDGPNLGPQWQWHANHRAEWWSMTARPKHLRLFAARVADADLARAPNLLLQKLPAESFQAETLVELEGSRGKTRAGLTVMGQSHAAVALEETARGHAVSLRVDNRVAERVETRRGPTRLGVRFAGGGACRFFFQTPGADDHEFREGFQATAGRWIGAKVGLFHVALGVAPDGAHADFRYFRFDAP
jgi:beta-xylosidase